MCHDSGYEKPNVITERCDYNGTGFKISGNISIVPIGNNYYDFIGYVEINDTWLCNYTRHQDLVSNHYRWNTTEDSMTKFEIGDKFVNFTYCFENNTVIYPINITSVYYSNIEKYHYLNWRMYPTFPEYILTNKTTFDQKSIATFCSEEYYNYITWRISNVSELIEGICNPFYNYTNGYRPYRECKIDGRWDNYPVGSCARQTTHFKIDKSLLNVTIDEKELVHVSGILIIHDNDECRFSYTPNEIYIRYGIDNTNSYYYSSTYKLPYCFENGTYYFNMTGLPYTVGNSKAYNTLNVMFCLDANCKTLLNTDYVKLSCVSMTISSGFMGAALIGEYGYGYCQEFYEFDGGNIPKALCLESGNFESFTSTQVCKYTGTKFVINRNFSIESVNSSYYHLYGNVVIDDDYYCKYTKKPDSLRTSYVFYSSKYIGSSCSNQLNYNSIPYCFPDNNTYTIHHDIYILKDNIINYKYINYFLIVAENDTNFACNKPFAELNELSYCPTDTIYSITWDYGSLDQYNEGNCPPFTNYNGPTIKPLRYCDIDGKWGIYDNIYECEPISIYIIYFIFI